MGILLRRLAVGRPAGMSNADLPRGHRLFALVTQTLNLADFAKAHHLLVFAQNRQTRRIIAPILKALQTLQ